MGRLLVLAMMLAVLCDLSPAQKLKSVNIRYPFLSLSYMPQPATADAKGLPVLRAVPASHQKETFGFTLSGLPATAPAIELLGQGGKVLKALSVNDLLGKGVSREEMLTPAGNENDLRRTEVLYIVRVAQGDVKIGVKAIASGDEGTANQELVMMFTIQAPAAMEAGLRAFLPVIGGIEAAGNGAIITPKVGNAGLAASLLPQSGKMTVEQGRVTVESGIVQVPPMVEVPVMWMIINGVGAESAGAVKTKARDVIAATMSQHDEPRVIVVNAVDRIRISQADTALYTLICANVGTGEAHNVVIGNPVPKGSRYLDGSATSVGMVFQHIGKGEGESGLTSGLKWSLQDALKPGEEKIISFKLVLE